jgi:hypothetical protein
MDETMMNPVKDINEKGKDKHRGRKHHKSHKRSRK